MEFGLARELEALRSAFLSVTVALDALLVAGTEEQACDIVARWHVGARSTEDHRDALAEILRTVGHDERPIDRVEIDPEGFAETLFKAAFGRSHQMHFADGDLTDESRSWLRTEVLAEVFGTGQRAHGLLADRLVRFQSPKPRLLQDRSECRKRILQGLSIPTIGLDRGPAGRGGPHAHALGGLAPRARAEAEAVVHGSRLAPTQDGTQATPSGPKRIEVISLPDPATSQAVAQDVRHESEDAAALASRALHVWRTRKVFYNARRILQVGELPSDRTPTFRWSFTRYASCREEGRLIGLSLMVEVDGCYILQNRSGSVYVADAQLAPTASGAFAQAPSEAAIGLDAAILNELRREFGAQVDARHLEYIGAFQNPGRKPLELAFLYRQPGTAASWVAAWRDNKARTPERRESAAGTGEKDLPAYVLVPARLVAEHARTAVETASMHGVFTALRTQSLTDFDENKASKDVARRLAALKAGDVLRGHLELLRRR